MQQELEEQSISLCLMKNFCIMGVNPACVAPKDMDCQCKFFSGKMGEDCQNRLFRTWCGSVAAKAHARLLYSLQVSAREVGL